MCSYIGPSNIAIIGVIKPSEFVLLPCGHPFGVSTVLPDNQTHIYTRNGGGHNHLIYARFPLLCSHMSYLACWLCSVGHELSHKLKKPI